MKVCAGILHNMSVCNEESLDPGQKPDGERQGTCVCCSSELSCYNPPPATTGTKHSITGAGIGLSDQTNNPFLQEKTFSLETLS